jgi:hypothetical protein
VPDGGRRRDRRPRSCRAAVRFDHGPRARSASARPAHGRAARRRDGPALRPSLLAVTRARPQPRRRQPGFFQSLLADASWNHLRRGAAPDRVIRRRFADRGSRVARPAHGLDRVLGGYARVPTCSVPRARLRTACGGLARVRRPSRPGGRDRTPRFPRLVPPGRPTCPGRLRPRRGISGDALAHVRARPAHARLAPARGRPIGGSDRGLPRRPRHLAGALPRGRAPLLRSGRAGCRLGSPIEEEAQCRRISCSRP